MQTKPSLWNLEFLLLSVNVFTALGHVFNFLAPLSSFSLEIRLLECGHPVIKESLTEKKNNLFSLLDSFGILVKN